MTSFDDLFADVISVILSYLNDADASSLSRAVPIAYDVLQDEGAGDWASRSHRFCVRVGGDPRRLPLIKRWLGGWRQVHSFLGQYGGAIASRYCRVIDDNFRGALVRVLEGEEADDFAPILEIIDHDVHTGVYAWDSVRLSLSVEAAPGAHPGLGSVLLFANLAGVGRVFRFIECIGTMRSLSVSADNDFAALHSSSRWQRVKLINWALMPLPMPAFDPPPAECFEGLFTGSYGPHGTEVILVTLIPQERAVDSTVSTREFIDGLLDAISDYSPPEEDGPPTRALGSSLDGGIFGPSFASWSETRPVSEFFRRGPVLVGRKVSGDANVPSGQLSFIASLHHQSRLTVEDFLLLCHPQIRDHAGLRDITRDMTHACIGAMQINVDPENWRPDFEVAVLAFQRDGTFIAVIVHRVAGGFLPDHGITFTRLAAAA